jgi:hypothetical protein
VGLRRFGPHRGWPLGLDELRDPVRPGWTSPTSRARILLGLGEVDQAFEEMEWAIEERDPIITPILCFPHPDRVRGFERSFTFRAA